MNEVTIFEQIDVYKQPYKLLWGFFKKPVYTMLWLAVVGTAIYFFADSALRYFDFNERAYGPYWKHPGWLLMHIIGGTVALFAGPVQFISYIRRKFISFHRTLGRLYVFGILIGSAGSLYLSTHPITGWKFGTSLFIITVFWLMTTGLAVYKVMRGNIEQHMVWMCRSYIITFGFATFRIWQKTSFLSGLGPDDRMTLINLINTVLIIGISEMTIFFWTRKQSQKLRKLQPVTA